MTRSQKLRLKRWIMREIDRSLSAQLRFATSQTPMLLARNGLLAHSEPPVGLGSFVV